MTDTDKIRDALRDRLLNVVSQRTGVSENALWLIRSGRTQKAHSATIKVLKEYLGLDDERV